MYLYVILDERKQNKDVYTRKDAQIAIQDFSQTKQGMNGVIQIIGMIKMLLRHGMTMEERVRSEVARLDERRILILTGPDSVKLLQGIVTSDMQELGPQTVEGRNVTRIALHTLFLSPKGRIVTDAFLIRPRYFVKGSPIYKKDEIWIDVEAGAKALLKAHIKKYMWRKKVDLFDVDNHPQEGKLPIFSTRNSEIETVHHLLGTSIEVPENESGEDGTYSNVMFFDPRGSQFGVRVVASQEDTFIGGYAEQLEKKEHEKLFMLLGECKHSLIHDKLPFMFNFDLTGSMCFTKGCFIGQEVVSRAYLTGIVRKRTFPFLLEDSAQRLEVGVELQNGSGDSLGKVVESKEGMGIVLVNCLGWTDKMQMQFVTPCRGQVLVPFARQLQEYFKDVQEKQKRLSDLDI